jgi:hypothetical protein
MSEKCFSINEFGRCKCLTVGNCIGYKLCSFYKTKEQNEADVKRAEERCFGVMGPDPKKGKRRYGQRKLD